MRPSLHLGLPLTLCFLSGSGLVSPHDAVRRLSSVVLKTKTGTLKQSWCDGDESGKGISNCHEGSEGG
eukprot:2344999-Amphidinium_carterae.1